jgi:hypothetical protein
MLSLAALLGGRRNDGLMKRAMLSSIRRFRAASYSSLEITFCEHILEIAQAIGQSRSSGLILTDFDRVQRHLHCFRRKFILRSVCRIDAPHIWAVPAAARYCRTLKP